MAGSGNQFQADHGLTNRRSRTGRRTLRQTGSAIVLACGPASTAGPPQRGQSRNLPRTTGRAGGFLKPPARFLFHPPQSGIFRPDTSSFFFFPAIGPDTESFFFFPFFSTLGLTQIENPNNIRAVQLGHSASEGRHGKQHLKDTQSHFSGGESSVRHFRSTQW
jgi:hypothetical protein